MIEVPLSQGLVALIDDVDRDIKDGVWHAVASNKTFYAIQNIQINGEWVTTARMHRLILQRVLDRPLIDDELVDHVDHNGLNNRRENLRLATRAQNSANQGIRSNNTSGMKGVSKDKRSGKWYAYITANRKLMHLGTFHSKTEAAIAYNTAALQHFGEYAYLNPIETEA